MFGFGPQRTGFNPLERAIGLDSVARLQELWRAAPAGGGGYAPSVANGTVYYGSTAFDATGRALWTSSTGNPGPSVPAVVDGVVYEGSRWGVAGRQVVGV
jgi:hypothetical protein